MPVLHRPRRRHVLTPLCLATALLVAALPVAAGAAQTATGTPITIGYMADANGTSAPVAAGMHLGTDLAVQQINAAGGVNGHPLQVQYVDPQSDPTQSVQMATQLIQNDQVDVLMGAVLSSECLAVQQLVGKFSTVVYLPTFGCAAEEFSTQSCNRYAFRFEPVGSQLIVPLVQYIVSTYGPNYAMMYSDYAYGVSQLNAFKRALQAQGGDVTVPIAVPQNEPNLAPYVTKVPTDGSVQGVIILGLGAGDLNRVSQALGQYGINQKVQIIGNSGKDQYGGTYPDFLNGSVNYQTFLNDQPPGNTDGPAYAQALKALAAQDSEAQWTTILTGKSGADGAAILEPYEAYPQYTAMTALKTAMVAANFTGRADTEKLISALEQVNIPLGPDAPGGAIIMNKADHQGAQTVYVYKINGQQEELLSTVPADQVPPLGNCQV
jgi:ABC-type branched-subunit amino acid transport system substrate-binding protein